MQLQKMSDWEQDLTDAVYNNDEETVRKYLKADEVRKTLGKIRRNKTSRI